MLLPQIFLDFRWQVNMTEQKYCQSAHQGASIAGGRQVHHQQQHLVRVDTPVTPPPPIPRRLLRGKSAWQASSPHPLPLSAGGQDGAHGTGTGTVFVYPQPENVTAEAVVRGSGDGQGGGGAGLQSALLVDIATRPASGYADADGISDDDRMSLENSVFDESLTSTPVKVAGYLAGRYAGLSHMAKRAQRSSSSTVDSAYGSSLGGHSERFASSSTSVDFRSRFSSVDTQSSLDEKPLSSSIDSPLARDPRDAYRERAVLNDAMHKLNNNNTSLGLALYSASNNNNGSSVASDGSQLPVVPARKQPPPVKGSSNSSNSIGETQSQSSKEPSSVSASASTSSAASAGSSTISSGTMSSMSGPCPAVVPPTDAITKRPGPPEPPLRQANVFDPVETGSRGHPPPPLTVRNKLGRNKPPPITYPRMQQRQDSTLSSDSYSISSSPGYNSKLMEAPLLGSQQGGRKSNAPGSAQRQTPLMDLAPTRFLGGAGGGTGSGKQGPAMPPPRSKINFRQDSTISSDSFSQTSSPGYNPKLMEAPLLPSLSAKRLCSGKYKSFPYPGLVTPLLLCPFSASPDRVPSGSSARAHRGTRTAADDLAAS